MLEVALEGLAKHIEEGTIQQWFVEEGDPVNAGDDLLEISTEDGAVTITAPVSGILAEVYYDEGEVVARGEILCMVDNEDEASGSREDDEEDEDDDSDTDEEDEDDEMEELGEEDEEDDEDEEE